MGGHIDQKYSLQAEGFTVEGVGGHIDQKYSLQAEGFTVEGVGGVTLIRNTHSRLRVLRWRGLGSH